IDPKVFNASRICRLYGTRACKGDSTPERPHRLSEIVSRPSEIGLVPEHLLQELAAEAEHETPAATHQTNGHANAAFDVQAFIDRHGLEVSGPQPWRGAQGDGRRWTFRKSPLCSHDEGAAFIVQHASGAVTATCHHASCSWTWADLRGRLEPKGAVNG